MRSIIIDLYGSSESIHDEFEISIQDNKENQYGDLASNVALVLAKPLKRNPKEIAEEIKGKFTTNNEIVKVDVAGPGFINFFLSKESHGAILRDISIQKNKFGKFDSDGNFIDETSDLLIPDLLDGTPVSIFPLVPTADSSS